MKKSFKRFLSSVLATVMAVAGMSIGMSTTVLADTSWDLTATAFTSIAKGVVTTIDGLTVKDNSSDANMGIKMDKNTKDPITGGYYVSFELAAGDHVEADICYSSTSAKTVAVALYSGTTLETDKVQVKTGDATKTAPANLVFDNVTSAGTYYLITDNTSAGTSYFNKITVVSGVASTGEINGTVSGFTTVPTGTFKYAVQGASTSIAITVADDGSYSITGLANGTYTITYTGTDYTMDPVDVTVASQTTAVTQNLTLSAIPKATNVALTVANATNQTVTLEGASYGVTYTAELVDGAATISEMLADTYTADITGGTIDPTEFTVTADTTTLTATFTKVTAQPITGPVATITFGTALGAPATDNEPIPVGDVFCDYFTSNGVKRRTTTSNGIEVRDLADCSFSFTTTVPLKLTIAYSSTGSSNTSDLAVRANGASTDLAYGAVTGTSNTDLIVDYLPAGTYSVYAPNTDSAITSARNTRVKTITFEEPTVAGPTITKTTSYGAPAVLQNGDIFYVVSIISAADVADTNNVLVNQNTASATIDSSNTVYQGMEVDGTVYAPSAFMDGAVDGSDCLFASQVTNDNATAVDEVVNKLTTAITTVLTGAAA